jgi:hypothetical protein
MIGCRMTESTWAVQECQNDPWFTLIYNILRHEVFGHKCTQTYAPHGWYMMVWDEREVGGMRKWLMVPHHQVTCHCHQHAKGRPAVPSKLWEYSYSQGAITANDLVLESCTWCKPPTTLLFAASRCKVGPAWRQSEVHPMVRWYGDTGSYWTPTARWLKISPNQHNLSSTPFFPYPRQLTSWPSRLTAPLWGSMGSWINHGHVAFTHFASHLGRCTSYVLYCIMYTVHIQHLCIICTFLMNISIINYCCYYRIYTLHYTTFLWRCCFDFWKTLSSYSVRPGPEIHTSNPGCHWTIGPQTMKSRSPKRRNYTTKLQIRQVICTKSIHVLSENSVSQNPLVHHKKKRSGWPSIYNTNFLRHLQIAYWSYCGVCVTLFYPQSTKSQEDQTK